MLSEADFFEHRSSVPSDLTVGILIGEKYELVRRLGSGAIGRFGGPVTFASRRR